MTPDENHPKTAPFDLRPACDVRAMRSRECWLIPLILPRGLTLLSADPKVGKSWMALGLALAVSEGVPFGGGLRAFGRENDEGEVVSQGPTLYFGREDNPDAVRSRLDALSRGLGKTPKLDNIYIACAASALDLDMDGPREQLVEAIEEYKPALVILDTARRFIGHLDENDSKEVSIVTSLLLDITKRYSTSILMLHHTNKGGGIRGSGEWRAASDCNLTVRATPSTLHHGGDVEGEAREVIYPYRWKYLVHQRTLKSEIHVAVEDYGQFIEDLRLLHVDPSRRPYVALTKAQSAVITTLETQGDGMATGELVKRTPGKNALVIQAIKELQAAGILEVWEIGNRKAVSIVEHVRFARDEDVSSPDEEPEYDEGDEDEE